MRENASTVLLGGGVALVPYAGEYVEKYHGWMQDEALLAATASEKLSLEEEVANCESWRSDPQKLTFIVMDRRRGVGVAAMVGDCNVFFLGNGDAEVEVMIAEESARRRGFASESVALLLRYVTQEGFVEDKAVSRFVAKVGEANEASLALFRDKLGFRYVQTVAAFEEVELELGVDGYKSSPLCTKTHYADCTLLQESSVVAQRCRVEAFDRGVDVILQYFGDKSVVVFCGDSLRGGLSLAAPALFDKCGDVAATSLVGDSQVASGIARRLSAKTGRLVFLGWAFDDDGALADDTLDLTLESALARRIPPRGWRPRPHAAVFAEDAHFSSFDDLRKDLLADDDEAATTFAEDDDDAPPPSSSSSSS